MKFLLSYVTRPFSIVSLLAIFIFAATDVFGETKVWTNGGGDGQFSTDANWLPVGIPAPTDTIVFNNLYTLSNCTVNVPITVAEVLMTNSPGTYTGTLVISNPLTVTGTFTARGTVNLTASSTFGSLRQVAGTFNILAGAELTLGIPTGSPAYLFESTGGTLNTNGLTVRANGRTDMNYFRVGSAVFHNLIVNNPLTLVDNPITVNGTLTVNGSLNGAQANVKGNIVFGATSVNGSSPLKYDGSTPLAATITGTTIKNPIEINNPNATVTTAATSGTVTWNQKVTLLAGILQQTAANYLFTNSTSLNNSGLTIAGGTFNGSAGAFNSVSLNISSGTFSGGLGTVGGGSGTSITQSGGTFSTQGDASISEFNLSGGTFNAPLGTMLFTGGSGNCSFTHTAAGGTFNPRTGTVAVQQGVCSFDVNSRETFNNLTLRGENQIAANDTLVVNGVTTFDGGGSNGGSIEANGDVRHTNGGTGNTNGDPTNGTTILKFVDTATRTLNLNTANQTYSTLAVLADNPNITLNFGTTPSAEVTVNAITILRGNVSQGTGKSRILNSFSQSGGVYNAGTFAGIFDQPTTGIGGNFALSGGTFNAGSYTQFHGDYIHTVGGSFNYGTGTVNFNAVGGNSAKTIDVNQSESFQNVIFSPSTGLFSYNIASGDTIIANGSLNFMGGGTVNGGTINAKQNVTVAAGSGGGTANLTFSGAADQTFTNNGGATINGTWIVNKPNSTPFVENNFAPAAATNLLISGNIGPSLVPLSIVSGKVVQTGAFDHALASLTLAPQTSFFNEFAGTITLGGDVVNDGTIWFNANGSGCQADLILIRSTNATQRSWSGSGFFQVSDIDVADQAGSGLISVYNGTDSGNNGMNWVFDPACIAPTSANVSVNGRVHNTAGNAVAGVNIVLTDSQGITRVARTNGFGIYTFDNVSVGQTVVITARHSKYTFVADTQVLTVSNDLADIDFVVQLP